MTTPSTTGEHRRPASAARAEASRRNGARSRGPVSEAGKARSARNALRHGLTATVHLVTYGEDPEALAALREGLRAELAAHGLLASCLADRLALALWKLARADRLEAALATIEPRCPTGRLFPEPGLPRMLSWVPELALLLRYQAQFGRELHRLLRVLHDPAFEHTLGAPADRDCADPAEPGEPEGSEIEPSGSVGGEPPDAAADAPTPRATAGAEDRDRQGDPASRPAVPDPPARSADPAPEPAARPTARIAAPVGSARTSPAVVLPEPSTVAEQLLAKGDLAGFLRVDRELRRSGAAIPRPGPAAAPPPAGPVPSAVGGAGRHAPVAGQQATTGRPPEPATTGDSVLAAFWRNEPEGRPPSPGAAPGAGAGPPAAGSPDRARQ